MDELNKQLKQEKNMAQLVAIVTQISDIMEKHTNMIKGLHDRITLLEETQNA